MAGDVAGRVTLALADALLRHDPRLALRVAATLGRALGPAMGGSRAIDVARLFGVSRGRSEEIARAMAATHVRVRAQHRLVRCVGLAGLAPLVRVVGREHLERSPAIFFTCHMGPLHAIGATLERLRLPALIFHGGEALHDPRATPDLELIATEGGEATRARGLKRAVERLRAGGRVVLAIDAIGDDRRPILGRPLAIARGPAVLLRFTGAPIVPLLARWKGRDDGSIELEARPPLTLPPGAGEDEVARALAAWLDARIRAEPGQLWPGIVRTLVAEGAPGAGAVDRDPRF